MSETNDGGCAFPVLPPDTEAYLTWPASPGMSLRDYFAAAWLSTVRIHDTHGADARWIAQNCYVMADAMLKAREEAK